MDAELKAKWVEALRSGKYQQGNGSLREGDKYCCLGVACDLVNSDAWLPVAEGLYTFKHEGERHMMIWPLAVQTMFGLDYAQSNKLWNMNDSSQSFAEIADYIEKNL